jgi:hypothetical protein
VTTYPTSQFLIATAAARHMIPRRSGSILFISTTAAAVTLPSDGFGSPAPPSRHSPNSWPASSAPTASASTAYDPTPSPNPHTGDRTPARKGTRRCTRRDDPRRRARRARRTRRPAATTTDPARRRRRPALLASDVLAFTHDEFTRLAAADEPVVRDILADGVALIGTIPRDQSAMA